MSKILDSAKAFEEKSKQHLLDIDGEVKNAFLKHRDALETNLQESEQTIADAILASNQRVSKLVEEMKTHEEAVIKSLNDAQKQLRRSVFKPYWLVVAGLAIAGVLLFAILWGLGMQISSKHTLIQQQNQKLEVLQDKTKGIQLTTCKTADNQSLICVAIDQRIKENWGENGEFRAVMRK